MESRSSVASMEFLAMAHERNDQGLTGGGLLFVGDRQGYFMALEARTGKVLWKFQTGGQSVSAGAVTYRFRGKQYVAVAAGGSIITFSLP
jgi:alcohol dehydrogenase (cytochrome c)